MRGHSDPTAKREAERETWRPAQPPAVSCQFATRPATISARAAAVFIDPGAASAIPKITSYTLRS